MNEVGYWATLVGYLADNELARGTFSAFLIVVLSVPAALVGQGLKIFPDWVVPPDTIPVWLGGLGLMAGVAIGLYTVLPTDLSMTVGMAAGLGAKPAHDTHRRYKPYISKVMKRTNGGTK